MKKPVVYLIHWNSREAIPRLLLLRTAGCRARHVEITGFRSMRIFREEPPAAAVIDLSRLPSHGRDIAAMLRKTKATRHIPIVFVGGESGKVERTREVIPDAVYTEWECIEDAIRTAIDKCPDRPVVPESTLAGYAGTPLPKKLGIKAGMRVAIIGRNESLSDELGKKPRDIVVRRTLRGHADLIIYFVKSKAELNARLTALKNAMTDGTGLWIAWPKKSAGVATDLSQTEIRRIGLASGMVDHKICAIDDTWSGLRFVLRKIRR